MKITLKPERYGGALEALLNFSLSLRNGIYSNGTIYLGSYDVIAPWIIEKIREREQREKKRQEEQPMVYIEDFPDGPMPKKEERKDSERGVFIIDIYGPNSD